MVPPESQQCQEKAFGALLLKHGLLCIPAPLISSCPPFLLPMILSLLGQDRHSSKNHHWKGPRKGGAPPGSRKQDKQTHRRTKARDVFRDEPGFQGEGQVLGREDVSGYVTKWLNQRSSVNLLMLPNVHTRKKAWVAIFPKFCLIPLLGVM